MSNSPVELFRRLTNGVYVIGVRSGEQQNAFTAAWVMQVSFAPLLVALSINPDHASFPLLTVAKGFAVSILPQDGLDLARHFGTQSGYSIDKLAGQEWARSGHGFPVLQRAIAWLDCAVIDQRPAGDHVLVIARVDGGTLQRPEVLPLRYSDTGNLDESAALFPPSFP
jgi:flavin reductase (DIM6/NTAB) family NADH-FMN oxidoreductase RutF